MSSWIERLVRACFPSRGTLISKTCTGMKRSPESPVAARASPRLEPEDAAKRRCSPRSPREGRVSEPRLGPKRKVAFLIGYNGAGFKGLQMNPGVPTIEAELWSVLCSLSYVSKDNADRPQKVSWMRTARTDSGVSALYNVVGLKIVEFEPFDDMVRKINELLHASIRVWKISHVMNSFDPKRSCSSRIYEYSFPLQLLSPCPFPSSSPYYAQPPVDREWALEQLKEFSKEFLGTRNYHNFTSKKAFADASAKRHMIAIDIMEPSQVLGHSWVTVRLHGQSFMIHQIRKMMAAVIWLIRTGRSPEDMRKLFEEGKVNVPRAPAVGLYLVQPLFQLYNSRLERLDHAKPPLPSDLSFAPDITTFKETEILSGIAKVEAETGVFGGWTERVREHFWDYEWMWNVEEREMEWWRREGKRLEEEVRRNKMGVESREDGDVDEMAEVGEGEKASN